MNAPSRTLKLIAAFALVLFGCDENTAPQPEINQAPDTSLIASAPRAIDDGRFEIDLRWEGEDPDGSVEAFEYLLAQPGEHRSAVATESAWIKTTESQLTLQLPTGAGESGISGDAPGFSFWVRAVDDRGLVDASAASVSFSSISLAPEVWITEPALLPANSCVAAPRAMYFEWEASDADAKGTAGIETRYALLPVEELVVPGEPALPAEICISRAEYERLDPVPWIDAAFWSEWVPYDTRNSVALPLQPVDSSMIFVVQTRDENGVRNRVHEWGRSVRHVRITNSLMPELVVWEPLLGLAHYVGTAGIKSFQVIGGQELAFEWQGAANSYAGIITGYRYGWDVIDVNDPDDPGWLIDWQLGPLSLRSPPRSFTNGQHRFVVQVRDNSGIITRAVYELEVLPQLPEHQKLDLLLVFDFGLGNTPSQQQLATEWKNQWQQLLQGLLPSFDPGRDIIDASDIQPGSGLELATLLDYRGVIWFANGASGTTALVTIAQPPPFSDRYNWIQTYQAYGGNLLLAGPSVSLSGVENIVLEYPLIYSLIDSPPLGLGPLDWLDGSTVARGALRWPHRGWCLEASDFVRPPTGAIYGELPGTQARSIFCDYLTRAEVDPDFLAQQPSAAAYLADLVMEEGGAREPNPLYNGGPDPNYKLPWEEFYDTNASPRSVTLNPRGCQEVMFRFRAARDDVFPDGHTRAGESVVDPATVCPPDGSVGSLLTGAPVAIMNSTFSNTKPRAGTHDFLWGFHPLAFEAAGVSDALAWILGQDWGLATTR